MFAYHSRFNFQPVDSKMKRWRGYLDEILHENRVTKVCLLRLGHSMYASSGRDFLFSDEEAEEIFNLMATHAVNIPCEIKGLLYTITENSDQIMVGSGSYALGADMVDEVVCVGRSREYLIVATADKENDMGQCKEEVQYIRNYLEKYCK